MEKMERMTKTLDAVNDRINWCSNLYGDRWREEYAVLDPCKEALEKVIEYDEQTETVPEPLKLVLVQYSCTDEGGVIDKETGLGWYMTDGRWIVLEAGTDTSPIVHKWRKIPEWRKEVDE